MSIISSAAVFVKRTFFSTVRFLFALMLRADTERHIGIDRSILLPFDEMLGIRLSYKGLWSCQQRLNYPMHMLVSPSSRAELDSSLYYGSNDWGENE